jgi:hypothetical protein
LLPPQPNPTAGEVAIEFRLPRPQPVRLEVFALNGARVREIAGGWRPAGAHVATWDGLDARGNAVRPGLYLVRLSTGERRITRMVVRLR